MPQNSSNSLSLHCTNFKCFEMRNEKMKALKCKPSARVQCYRVSSFLRHSGNCACAVRTPDPFSKCAIKYSMRSTAVIVNHTQYLHSFTRQNLGARYVHQWTRLASKESGYARLRHPVANREHLMHAQPLQYRYA